ncbi:MAG: hypothetical protein LV479_09915 [Methylacidiphilales bacterium]|nr:hypothetical protein [Candidatus Methylacidiphilales bacterium]
MAATAGWAQNPAAETLQQNVPLSQQAPPPTPTTTSDQDLGELSVVQKFPKPEMFSFWTTQQFFYTDNVFYTDANPVSSTAYLGSYTASFVPYSLRDWTPRVSLQYNMVRYGDASSGDFDNENLALSSQYIFSEDRNWSWTATVDLSRFTAPHANDHEFYKEVVYDNQITRVAQLIQGTPLFFIGAYDLAYHQTSPAIFDRLDNTLSFSLAYYPMKEISIGPFIRAGARTYFTDGVVNGITQHDRDDFNLAEGLDVTWMPCKYVSLSADFSHVNDYSDNTSLSYNNTVPGVSVTGTVKF